MLGIKKKFRGPSWISMETRKLQEQRDKARSIFRRNKSTEARKKWRDLAEEVNKSYQKDEMIRLERQISELEYAANTNKLKKTWEIINELSGKAERKVLKVKMLNGSEPKSPDELLGDWVKYFENLLNGRAIDTDSFPEPARKDMPIKTSFFSREEIDIAINQLHSNKSPGIDNAITPEVLKHGGEFIREKVHSICNKVLESGQAPSQWKSSMIVPVPKKGNLQLMNNYRGISLMSIAAKTYNKAILNRIMPSVDKILRNNQAGFRSGRSCVQQIHILRRLIEGAASRNLPLYATFIDFKKAFDSINRSMMFAILRHYGIPERIVSAIRILYEGSTSRVLIDGQLSKEFAITTGVLQGDVLAPFLFIIVIDYVMNKSENDYGFITHPRKSSRYPQQRLNDLDYADDIALLEGSQSRAQEQLEECSRTASSVGLEINIGKTKQIIFNAAASEPLKLNGEEIEIVNDFKYLGSLMATTGNEIKSRKGQAWSAFWKMTKLWHSSKMSLALKMRIFKASVISVLLYGSEAWLITKYQMDSLDSFATSCYRIMLNIRRLDHVTNEEIYKRVNQQPLSISIQRRQLTWIGHILRREPEEPIRKYALYQISNQLGTSKIGGHTTDYANYIAKIISKEARLTAQEIEKAANKRESWKKLVIACTPAGD